MMTGREERESPKFSFTLIAMTNTKTHGEQSELKACGARLAAALRRYCTSPRPGSTPQHGTFLMDLLNNFKRGRYSAKGYTGEY